MRSIVTALLFMCAPVAALCQWDEFGRVPSTQDQGTNAVREPRIVADDQGRILIATSPSVRGAAGEYIVITRRTPDGRIDETFGTSGTSTVLLPDSISNVNVTDLQAFDGRIMVLARATPATQPSVPRMVVVRMNSSGSLDPFFDGDGVVIDNSPEADTSSPTAFLRDAEGLAVQLNTSTFSRFRRISVLGQVSTWTPPFMVPSRPSIVLPLPADKTMVCSSGEVGADDNIAVRRYLASGQPDASFGNAGAYVWKDLMEPAVPMILATAHHGGTVDVFTREDGLDSIAVAIRRFPPTFGASDVPPTYLFKQLKAGNTLTPASMTTDSASRVWIGGLTFTDRGVKAVVIRYTPELRLDDAFGFAGYWYADTPEGTSYVNMLQLITAPTGNVYGVLAFPTGHQGMSYHVQRMDEGTVGVREIPGAGRAITAVSVSGGVVVRGLEEGATVEAFDLTGRRIATAIAGAGDTFVGMGMPGLYILRSGCCAGAPVLVR